MIDRSTLVIPLRPRLILVSAGISAALFSLLLVVWLLCWVAAGVSFGACWLAFLLLLILAYGLLLALVAAIGGAAFALFTDNDKKTDDEKKGAGCGGIILVLIALAVLSNGWQWVGNQLEAPQKTLSQAADDAFEACQEGANYVLYKGFLHYKVYIWSWSVLALALATAGLTLLLLGVLCTEGLCKRIFLRVRFKCPRCPYHGPPVFRCLGCSELHTDLRPSLYGLLSAKCGRCTRRLPTLDLFGRLGLEKVCANPKCNHDLKGAPFGKVGEFHFAVVGAQSSGKSNYMIAALGALLGDFASDHGYQTEFPDPRQKQEFNGYILGFENGRAVPKTSSSQRSLAFNVALRPRGRLGCLLYLYDAAGEDFEAGDLARGTHGLSGQDYHGFIDGVLFIIDPFAEEGVQRQRLARAGDNPARYDASFMLSRLLPFWERSLHIPADRKIPVPVAVVVTKSDACGLESQLSSPDVRGRYSSSGQAAEAAAEDSDRVRQFLLDSGAGDAVRILETRFTQVRYFGVSALGRGVNPANRTPFRPRRVLGPLLWLCHEAKALTDRSPVLQSLGHGLDFGMRCLRGREGRLVGLACWCLLVSLFCSMSYVVWSWAGLPWALGSMAGLVLVPVLGLRLRANGLGDVRAGIQGLAQVRQWLQEGATGRAGSKRRIQAGGVLVLLVATFAALLYVWWPLGVGMLVLLLVLVGLSSLGG